MEAFSIKLTLAELKLLEDSISNLMFPSAGIFTEDQLLPLDVPTKSLCLKIGSALIEALKNEDQEIELTLTEEDYWIFRERVSIFKTIGTIRVGENTKRKIYTALLSITDQKNLKLLGEDITFIQKEGLHEEQRSA